MANKQTYMPAMYAFNSASNTDISQASSLQFTLTMNPKTISELSQYQSILEPPRSHDAFTGRRNLTEETKTAPLVWWDVKEECERGGPALLQAQASSFSQYGVLGHVPDQATVDDEGKIVRKPVLLNTNSPWSAFLCGSQGSGKSHTLSCILENYLMASDRMQGIGKNPNPLASLVFHFDKSQSSGVCEAAYLCSDIPTTVLVSPSNFGKRKDLYDQLQKKHKDMIDVQPLYLLPQYLDTARFKALMAIGKDETVPLYMQVSCPPHDEVAIVILTVVVDDR